MQPAIKFDAERLLLPVSIDLQDKLSEIIIKSGKLIDKTKAVTVNLRDKGYSPESGGWHPVEIRISRCGELWQFEYLTDFSYQGCGYPELVKEVDFDFINGEASFLFSKSVPISDMDVSDFYQVWETNLLSYLSMGSFDEMEVTTND
ncbi:DUF2787 family protein [Vibrio cortegadensis]|uniref:DUF2787 family protein n=1 Tax=Vibrio cortegadensis TaxID=1328770 RepID=UPI00352C999A